MKRIASKNIQISLSAVLAVAVLATGCGKKTEVQKVEETVKTTTEQAADSVKDTASKTAKAIKETSAKAWDATMAGAQKAEAVATNIAEQVKEDVQKVDQATTNLVRDIKAKSN